MVYTNKKKYFFFPKLSLKYLLFLFFFIASFIKKTVQTYFENNQKIAIEFLKLYMYDVGDFLSIIPLIITKIRMKTEKKKEESNEEISKSMNITNNIELIYNNDIEDKNNCNAFKYVFIFTIADMVAQLAPVVYYVIKEDQKLAVKQANLNTRFIFNIIFIIIFSRIILKTKFYRHHIFAFSIDIFGLIVLTIIDIIIITNDSGDNITMSIIYILVKILGVILYSLQNSLAKYLFLYYYLTTYSLLVNKSIFQFFYLLIFSFPFIFKKMEIKDGESKTIFSMIADIFEDKIYYGIVIGYTITSFFCNNLGCKIIEEFSPNHFIIAKLLENFGIFLIDLIINGPDSEVYLIVVKIIMNIILILSSLIFNEILVINICGLSKDTKLFLDYEAEKEELINEEKEDEKSSDFNEGNLNIGMKEIELEETF